MPTGNFDDSVTVAGSAPYLLLDKTSSAADLKIEVTSAGVGWISHGGQQLLGFEGNAVKVQNPVGDTVLRLENHVDESYTAELTLNSDGYFVLGTNANLILQPPTAASVYVVAASTVFSHAVGGPSVSVHTTEGSVEVSGVTTNPSQAASVAGKFFAKGTTFAEPYFVDNVGAGSLGARPLLRGPTSSSDNFVPRFDGATGGLLQGSSLSVDDSGNVILGSSSQDIQFGATVGGSYRRIRGVAGGLNIEDTTGGGTATVKVIAASVHLDASQHVYLDPVGDVDIQASGTSWARFVGSSKRLGVGTTAPAYRFEVEDTQSSAFISRVNNLSTGSGADVLLLRVGATTSDTGNRFLQFGDAGGVRGWVRGNGGGVDYQSASDERLKQDIHDAPPLLDTLLRIRVREYAWRHAPAERQIGFIAQELGAVWPSAASGPGARNDRKVVRLLEANAAEDATPEERLVDVETLEQLRLDPALRILDVSDLTEAHPEYAYWGVDYGKLTPLLVKVVQEQAGEIASLRAAVTDLLRRVEALEAR